MAWKDLAEKLQVNIKDLQDKISILQYELAESQENNTIAISPGRGHSHTGQVQQVINLQHELQSIRAERDDLAAQVASLNETLQNTMAKISKLEPAAASQVQTLDTKNRLLASQIETLEQEKKTLEYKIRGQEETMRKVQAQRSADLNLSGREKSLQEQNKKLKDDIGKANLRAERLGKQLEAEKKNNGDLGWRSNPDKGYDQDDEEPLPVENPRLKAEAQKKFTTAMAESTKQFKNLSIPDDLKPVFERPKPSRKSRKRSLQEELDDEVAELSKYDPSQQLKRRRAAMDYGSLDAPVNVDTSDDELPDPATFADKTKKKPVPLINPASKVTTKPLGKITLKKPAPAPAGEPPTPISPASPTFSSPDSTDFAFKAVCTYHRDGTPHNVYHCSDLKPMTELWDRITLITNNWESCAGDDWKFEYEQRTRKAKAPSCITRKLQKGRTYWRAGSEGKHACKDCAKAGRPCFTYAVLENANGFEYGEYRLLPLHEADRKKAVAKDKEIRYWVDDAVKIVDPEEEDEGMDWE